MSEDITPTLKAFMDALPDGSSRRMAFYHAREAARKCGCEYCKAVVDALYDALADHGEIA